MVKSRAELVSKPHKRALKMSRVTILITNTSCFPTTLNARQNVRITHRGARLCDPRRDREQPFSLKREWNRTGKEMGSMYFNSIISL